MKKIKYIGHKKPIMSVRKVQKYEHVQISTIAEENNLDMSVIAKKINIAFLLADIMESLVLDIEDELKSTDNTVELQIKHPISRIKIHTRELVGFVSETYKNGDGAIDFGNKSDEYKKSILHLFDSF